MTLLAVLLAASTAYADVAKDLMARHIKETVETYDKLALVENDMMKAQALGDTLAWKAAFERGVRLEKGLRLASEKAITLALEHYGIAPDGTQLKWGESAVAQEGPRSGLRIKWQPKLDFERQRYFSYEDATGGSRYFGPPPTFDSPYRGDTTYPEGTVVIDISIFRDADREGNPGVLGYILHHESMHFADKLTQGEKTREQGEVDAYSASLKQATRFGLGPSWVRKFNSALADYQLRIDRGLARSPYLTKAEEEAIKAQHELEQRKLEEERKERARLLREAAEAEHLDRLERLCALACIRELEESDLAFPRMLSADRYEAKLREHERLQTTPPNCRENACVEIYDALWHGRPINLARASAVGLVQRLAKEASGCGLTALIDKDTGLMIGFADPYGSEFTFTTLRSADDIRLNMVLAHACAMAVHDPVWQEQKGYDPACNERGFSILESGWAPAGLTDKVGLKVRSAPRDRFGWVSHCLEYDLRGLADGISRRHYKKFVRNLVKRWRQAWIDQAEAEEAVRRAREQRERQQRQPRDPIERPWGCADPNPITGIVGCPG